MSKLRNIILNLTLRNRDFSRRFRKFALFVALVLAVVSFPLSASAITLQTFIRNADGTVPTKNDLKFIAFFGDDSRVATELTFNNGESINGINGYAVLSEAGLALTPSDYFPAVKESDVYTIWAYHGLTKKVGHATGTLISTTLSPQTTTSGAASGSPLLLSDPGLDVPTGFTATTANSKVYLSWNRVTGASGLSRAGARGYRLYRYDGEGARVYKKVAEVTSREVTGWVDEGITVGQTYHYILVAVDGLGSFGGHTEEISIVPSADLVRGGTGGTGGTGEVTDPYADPDKDSFNNLNEYLAGTNPTDPTSYPLDKDGDKMADSWEVTYGVTDPYADPDKDGFNNLNEYQAGTNPNDPTSQPVKESPVANQPPKPTDPVLNPVTETGPAVLVGQPLNYPNPFDPVKDGKTNLSYTLSAKADITVFLYDMTGNLIWRKLYFASDTEMGGKSGYNEVAFDGQTDFGYLVGNGMYTYIITADGGRVLGKGRMVVYR